MTSEIPDCVPATLVPPGTAGALVVDAEHGDIMVHAEFAATPLARSCCHGRCAQRVHAALCARGRRAQAQPGGRAMLML